MRVGVVTFACRSVTGCLGRCRHVGSQSRERGQSLLLVVAGLAAVLVGALVLGAIARGVGVAGSRQRAADLGALAAARWMHESYPRLFEPARLAGRPNPRHLELGDYLAAAREAARGTARANGARRVAVRFPDGSTIAPIRVRVAVSDPVRVEVGGRHEVPSRVVAEAELVPPSAPVGADAGSGYRGPLAHRQGKPMRPDVAAAFDRLAAAAHSNT